MKDGKVITGEEAKFSVKVTGTPLPEVEWQKGSKPIRDGRRIKLDKGDDGVHTLCILSTETADQGGYTCIAKNKAGRVSCTAKLTVESKFLDFAFVIFEFV